MFGNDILNNFSRTEDVALIEYSWLSCCLISMFSLETGRVKPETFRFSYYTFPNALEFFLVKNCLFSFWKDCLSSWTACQRKVLSPGTRADILVGQIDHSFEGMDGGIGSQCHDIWNSLQAMNVGVNSLHFQLFVFTDRKPCMIYWCLQAGVAAGTFPGHSSSIH
ncbi:5'-adenylylsulfate reductase 3, chloroplastic-like [Pistacia vera]|uniref:5'-adenylylsulfate reductase 3, chloroplastic-like n=1 Tax=Pistacia vera TaxID=55513 RepID=UPI001263C142|nr:5'-adenylylsulfate reductase 3, chloroplastic-like [Pistacia vera]